MTTRWWDIQDTETGEVFRIKTTSPRRYVVADRTGRIFKRTDNAKVARVEARWKNVFVIDTQHQFLTPERDLIKGVINGGTGHLRVVLSNY